MKQLKNESKDLWSRTKKMGKSIALTVILLLQFITQIIILFFALWITVFTKGKEITDRKTFKISYGSLVPMILLTKEN